MNTVSIVVPFLNEADCLIPFCEYADTMAKDAKYHTELIFVDDGSTDDSLARLHSFTFHNCRSVKIISLTKNFGSHAAIRAGIQEADGDFCTYLGVDMEEPPQMVGEMYDTISQGLDAVYIEKHSVKTSASTRLFSRTYSALIRKYAVKEYGSGGINNIMFSRKVINFLNTNIESNSSLQLQILNAGFKSAVLEMDYRPRTAGVSKWTFAKKIKLFVDSFVAFSYMPIRAVTLTGIVLAFLGVLGGITYIVFRFTISSLAPGYASIVVLLLFGFGITNISLGIIAEYLWRTYDAARGRPVFIIDQVEQVHTDK